LRITEQKQFVKFCYAIAAILRHYIVIED